MDWVGRLSGYTGAGGAVQGFAVGYFMCNVTVSILHLRVLGWYLYHTPLVHYLLPAWVLYIIS